MEVVKENKPTVPARTFILERSAFNKTQLAKEIHWSKQSMHAWLNSRRGIPKSKLKLLEDILAQYGYRQWLRLNFQQSHDGQPKH